MAPRSRGRISVAAAVVIVLGACGSKNSGSDEPKPEIPPATVFKVSDFSNPTQIDNLYYPMEPGTRWTFEGSADRGTGREPHQVIITVTDLVKDIHGVTNVVVWEEDLDEGILAESELAFFAQDDSGNLWNFGEYPELWEKKKFKGAPSTWISASVVPKAVFTFRASPRRVRRAIEKALRLRSIFSTVRAWKD